MLINLFMIENDDKKKVNVFTAVAINSQLLKALHNGGMLDPSTPTESQFSAVILIYELLQGACNSQGFMQVYKDYEISGCFDAVVQLQSSTPSEALLEKV